MVQKFEDLLKGKPIHLLTDEEIRHIITQLDDGELARFNKEVRKASRPKRESKKSSENKDLFEKAMLKGGKNDS